MKKTVKFLYKGKSYSVDAERDGSILNLEREGVSYSVTLLEEKRTPRKAAPAAPRAVPAPGPAAAPAPAAAPVAAAPGALGAPMTGTVKELKVSSGDEVTSGRLVMVMEAMKMDIEVFSDRAGVVKEIFVKPGDAVKEKQPLMQIG